MLLKKGKKSELRKISSTSVEEIDMEADADTVAGSSSVDVQSLIPSFKLNCAMSDARSL